jgi:hypothetical protein
VIKEKGVITMRTLFTTLLVYLLLLFLASTLQAQWVQTNGPYGGTVYCFAVNGQNLFVGTSSGVYLSTNNGTSWTNVGFLGYRVWDLAVYGTNLLAASDAGVQLSTNNGTSWTDVSPVTTYCFSLAVIGTNIFAGTYFCGDI